MDYSVRNVVQQLVYHQKIKDIDHPKQVLNSCWDKMNQELIHAAVDQSSK